MRRRRLEFLLVVLLDQEPRLADQQVHYSRAERIREWRLAVEQIIAALHPLFKENWQWSWTTAESFYKYWLTLDRTRWTTLCCTGRILPRYQWIEDYIKEKVVNSLPRKFRERTPWRTS